MPWESGSAGRVEKYWPSVAPFCGFLTLHIPCVFSCTVANSNFVGNKIVATVDDRVVSQQDLFGFEFFGPVIVKWIDGIFWDGICIVVGAEFFGRCTK